MSGDKKVKDAKEREMTFHEKVYEDMKEKIKSNEKKTVPKEASAREDTTVHPEARSSGAQDVRAVKKLTLKARRGEKFEKVFEEEANELGTKRAREDQREREAVEVECDEEVDEDGDLDLNWVEFAMNIDGVDYVQDINVEKFISEDTEREIMEAFDDVTGLAIDVTKTRAARGEEIRYIESHGIWEVVPVEKCWKHLGKAPISGRWVDVQKGDDVRSRYVGRDFKPKGEGPRAEIFASMPPLEAKKILFSLAASQLGSVRKKKLLFIDVKKAHMNAVCKEWAFVDLPEEIHREGLLCSAEVLAIRHEAGCQGMGRGICL